MDDTNTALIERAAGLMARSLAWLRDRPCHSWVDSWTGGYRVGPAVKIVAHPHRIVIAQDWHTREVVVLNSVEVATLRPYPAEPIPQPD
jgi:hypothetical protein